MVSFTVTNIAPGCDSYPARRHPVLASLVRHYDAPVTPETGGGGRTTGRSCAWRSPPWARWPPSRSTSSPTPPSSATSAPGPLAGLAVAGSVLTAAFTRVQLPRLLDDRGGRPPVRRRQPHGTRPRPASTGAGWRSVSASRSPCSAWCSLPPIADAHGRVGQRRPVRGHLPPHQHPRRARAPARARGHGIPPRHAGHPHDPGHRGGRQRRQPAASSWCFVYGARPRASQARRGARCSRSTARRSRTSSVVGRTVRAEGASVRPHAGRDPRERHRGQPPRRSHRVADRRAAHRHRDRVTHQRRRGRRAPDLHAGLPVPRALTRRDRPSPGRPWSGASSAPTSAHDARAVGRRLIELGVVVGCALRGRGRRAAALVGRALHVRPRCPPSHPRRCCGSSPRSSRSPRSCSCSTACSSARATPATSPSAMLVATVGDLPARGAARRRARRRTPLAVGRAVAVDAGPLRRHGGALPHVTMGGRRREPSRREPVRSLRRPR